MLASPKEILESCGLYKHRNKAIKFFSSGMKQKAKLALTFYTKSNLILLDEPTSNLDSANTDWFLNFMHEKQGTCTIIMASNNQKEYSLCKNVVSIEQYK